MEKTDEVLPSLGLHSSERRRQEISASRWEAQDMWSQCGAIGEEREGPASGYYCFAGRPLARGGGNDFFLSEPQCSTLSSGHLGHIEKQTV